MKRARKHNKKVQMDVSDEDILFVSSDDIKHIEQTIIALEQLEKDWNLYKKEHNI